MDGLLTLARIDAGQLASHHEPVDFREVVNSSVELFQPLADRKHIEVACDLQTVQVAGDAERLCQVVANLIGNAISYNHEGGQVRLHLAAEEHYVVLSVSDTGLGIGESDLPRIFERFYRVDPARSGAHGGVGLGLAICQEIVRNHGGIIDAASVVGEGTTFTVRLPILTPQS